MYTVILLNTEQDQLFLSEICSINWVSSDSFASLIADRMRFGTLCSLVLVLIFLMTGDIDIIL